MLPAAPTRFSTSTGCPRRSVSFGARMRELMSVGPPGAKGTTQRIGWLGKAGAVCACAAHAPSVATAASVRTSVDLDLIPPPGSVLLRLQRRFYNGPMHDRSRLQSELASGR